jgi:Cu+-exporting ATPase
MTSLADSRSPKRTANDSVATIDLAISGMTCASCANRIEKRLNKLEGVTATVNYATEKARVSYRDDVTPLDLVAAVEKAGYRAALPAPPRAAGTDEATEADDPTALLRRRLLICTSLTVPVVAMAMVPALQFTYWQWLSLTLAAPVVVWGAWPFHTAAWANLKHATSTMDTLISMGALAAFGWSLYALFLGTAGVPGMKHPFELTISRGDGSASMYLEAATGVTTFCSPAATSRSGRSAEPAPPCARCLSSARKRSRCCAAAPNSGSPPSS